jgi:hypothetical protein
MKSLVSLNLVHVLVFFKKLLFFLSAKEKLALVVVIGMDEKTNEDG